MQKIFKKLKNVGLAFLAMMTVVGPNPVIAESSERYVGVVLLDKDNKNIQLTVTKSEGATIEDEYKSKKGNLPSGDGDISDVSSGDVTGEGGYLSFPGLKKSEERKTSSRDEQQAKDVMGKLVTDFNSAISFVLRYGNLEISDKNNATALVTGIAKAAKEKGEYAGIDFRAPTAAEIKAGKVLSPLSNGTTFCAKGTIANNDTCEETLYTSYDDGATVDNFIVLDSGKDKLLLTYSLDKGYFKEGNIYYNSNYVPQGDVSKGAGVVSWYGIAWYALQGDRIGMTADSGGSDKFNIVGDLAEHLVNFVKSLVNTLVSFVGLYSVEELMFNRTARATDYFLGMMPYQWFRAASVFFWISQVISVVVIFTAIMKLLIKKNLSVISPTQRESYKEGIMNLCISLLLMSLYLPSFYIMAKANSYLVDTFAVMFPGQTLYDGITGNAFLAVIFSVAYLYIIIKINVTYIIRAITITLLHIFAPVAIASLALGNKKGLFSNWLKELFVNIFIQSMNALLLAFYISFTYRGKSSLFETIILLFSFIPLNKWIKDNLLGFRGVGPDKAAEEADNGVLATTGAMAIGAASTAVRAGKGAVGAVKSIAGKDKNNSNNSPTKGKYADSDSKSDSGSSKGDSGKGSESSKSNNSPQKGKSTSDEGSSKKGFVDKVADTIDGFKENHPIITKAVATGAAVTGAVAGAAITGTVGTALTVGGSSAGRAGAPIAKVGEKVNSKGLGGGNRVKADSVSGSNSSSGSYPSNEGSTSTPISTALEDEHFEFSENNEIVQKDSAEPENLGWQPVYEDSTNDRLTVDQPSSMGIEQAKARTDIYAIPNNEQNQAIISHLYGDQKPKLTKGQDGNSYVFVKNSGDNGAGYNKYSKLSTNKVSELV